MKQEAQTGQDRQVASTGCEWRDECIADGYTEEELGNELCDEDCPRCDPLRK